MKTFHVSAPAYNLVVKAADTDGAIVASYNQAGHAETCIADLATSLDTTQEAIRKDVTVAEIDRVWVEILQHEGHLIGWKTYRATDIPEFSQLALVKIAQDAWDSQVGNTVSREGRFDCKIILWGCGEGSQQHELLSVNPYELD